MIVGLAVALAGVAQLLITFVRNSDWPIASGSVALVLAGLGLEILGMVSTTEGIYVEERSRTLCGAAATVGGRRGWVVRGLSTSPPKNPERVRTGVADRAPHGGSACGDWAARRTDGLWHAHLQPLSR